MNAVALEAASNIPPERVAVCRLKRRTMVIRKRTSDKSTIVLLEYFGWSMFKVVRISDVCGEDGEDFRGLSGFLASHSGARDSDVEKLELPSEAMVPVL
jgi:hypothetical protein